MFVAAAAAVAATVATAQAFQLSANAGMLVSGGWL